MSRWREPVDLYCERTDPGLWAEPLNALTNLAFIVAGLYLIGRFRRERELRALALIGAFIVGIGFGSGAFHVFAEKWAEAADVLSILLTLLLYVCVWLRLVWGVPWRWAWLGAPGFIAWSLAIAQIIPPGIANGSGGYAPALLGLLAMAAGQALRGAPGAGGFLAAAGVFSVSLTFRSVDQALCEVWPYGTHFLWHLLNATTLTVATLALARARVSQGGG